MSEPSEPGEIRTHPEPDLSQQAQFVESLAFLEEAYANRALLEDPEKMARLKTLGKTMIELLPSQRIEEVSHFLPIQAESAQALYEALKARPETLKTTPRDQLNVLGLYIFSYFNEAEISRFFGVTKQEVSRRIQAATEIKFGVKRSFIPLAEHLGERLKLYSLPNSPR